MSLSNAMIMTATASLTKVGCKEKVLETAAEHSEMSRASRLLFLGLCYQQKSPLSKY